MLPRFFHCSKQEARAVAVDICPAVVVPERTLATAVPPEPAAVPSTDAVETPAGGRAAPAEAARGPGPQTRLAPAASNSTVKVNGWREGNDGASELALAPLPVGGKRDALTPLTRDRARLHVTVSRRLLEKLEAARAALSHVHPGASAGELLEAGLDLLLAEHAKRKGLVQRPRPPRRVAAGSVPAHVKREVWKRDGGRCQWPVEDGEVCGSRLRVELDHVIPKARGGPATVPGMRLL